MKIKDSGLTKQEVRYLQYITESDDPQKALDMWLKYAGWYECGMTSKQVSIEARINRAKKLASKMKFH